MRKNEGVRPCKSCKKFLVSKSRKSYGEKVKLGYLLRRTVGLAGLQQQGTQRAVLCVPLFSFSHQHDKQKSSPGFCAFSISGYPMLKERADRLGRKKSCRSAEHSVSRTPP